MPIGGPLILKGKLKVTKSGVEKTQKKKKKAKEPLTEEEKQLKEEQREFQGCFFQKKKLPPRR